MYCRTPENADRHATIKKRRKAHGQKPEPIPVPPTVAPSVAGSLPLFQAVHWIVSEGGRVNPMVAKTAEDWRNAYTDLVSCLAAGEIGAIGYRADTPETIDPVTFSGIRVSSPFDEDPDLNWRIINDDRLCLWSYRYINDEKWRSGHCDSLRAGGQTLWTMVMVSGVDLERVYSFGKARAYRTAMAGRPSSCDVILEEFDRRVRSSTVAPTLREQALELRRWLQQHHPGSQQPKQKTTENHLRKAYRLAKIRHSS
jgi:hypothetical protein